MTTTKNVLNVASTETTNKMIAIGISLLNVSERVNIIYRYGYFMGYKTKKSKSRDSYCCAKMFLRLFTNILKQNLRSSCFPKRRGVTFMTIQEPSERKSGMLMGS